MHYPSNFFRGLGNQIVQKTGDSSNNMVIDLLYSLFLIAYNARLLPILFELIVPSQVVTQSILYFV